MSSLSRRACFKCGNVGHYAGKPHLRKAMAHAAVTLSGAAIARWRLQQWYLQRATMSRVKGST
jgi:hypothetical protein